jgi:hypothetical protein
MKARDRDPRRVGADRKVGPMSAPTKKDFNRAVVHIRTAPLTPEAKKLLTDILCDIFSELSGRFDEEKFRTACGFPEPQSSK